MVSLKCITAVFLLSVFICTVEARRRRDETLNGQASQENLRPRNEGSNGEQERDWMKLCKCAKPALHKMQVVLSEYTAKVTRGNVKRSSRYTPPALNEVIDKIKKIAYDCTKQRQCRCPEGYLKTNDGYHCLKISKDAVSCQDAVEACSSDVNARLAIAKDHNKLTDLADYIRETDETDDSYYWIGLSYNRTEGGMPVWTWDDGSKASYSITKDLSATVKKSLQLSFLSDENDTNRAIERVAISKDYHGTHWRQETCLDEKFGAKYRYICEFLMFKVEIKAVSSQSSQAASLSGKNPSHH